MLERKQIYGEEGKEGGLDRVAGVREGSIGSFCNYCYMTIWMYSNM